MMMGTLDSETTKRRLRFDYVRVKGEPGSRAVDGITSLVAHLHKPQFNIVDVIQDASNIIQRQFKLKWVMIGIKGKNDGLFRYTVMTGMRPDVWERQRKRTYGAEDFETTCGNYKFGEISDLTRVYLQEDNPLYSDDEKKLVQRPALLMTKRMSSSETLEADFIDTLIYGPGRNLLGWIEYSGTVANEFPQSVVIRQIEGYAAVLGVAVAIHLRS
ncbi:MAG TPA: hypothetical protein HA364_07310 [Thermoplasmata archaeon]|nr:hypothetical protein [Thermoplasmata archaeon]